MAMGGLPQRSCSIAPTPSQGGPCRKWGCQVSVPPLQVLHASGKIINDRCSVWWGEKGRERYLWFRAAVDPDYENKLKREILGHVPWTLPCDSRPEGAAPRGSRLRTSSARRPRSTTGGTGSS